MSPAVAKPFSLFNAFIISGFRVFRALWLRRFAGLGSIKKLGL